MKIPLSGFIAACLICIAPVHAADTIPLWFRADVAIAPDGTLTAFEWRNFKPMPESVLDGLEPVVQAWEFRPASVDGVPVRTETTLYIRMDAIEQEGGAYGLAVVNAFVGPSIVEPAEAAKPVPVIVTGSLRSSEVVLDVAWPIDGTPAIEVLDYQATTRNGRYRSETEDKARKAVNGWEVRHERVAGQPVPAHLRYVYGRCMDSDWCVRNAPESMATLPEMPPGQPTPLDSVAELLTYPVAPE